MLKRIQRIISNSLETKRKGDKTCINSISSPCTKSILTIMVKIDLTLHPDINLHSIDNPSEVEEIRHFLFPLSNPDVFQRFPNLRRLHIGFTGIKDISFIRNHRGLEELWINENPELSEIDAIGSLTNLKNLYMAGTRVVDIRPLRDLKKLERLNISSTKVTSLQPLSELSNLSLLSLQHLNHIDLEPLKDLFNLKLINLNETWVDLRPLEKIIRLGVQVKVDRNESSQIHLENCPLGIFVSHVSGIPNDVVYEGNDSILSFWQGENQVKVTPPPRRVNLFLRILSLLGVSNLNK